MPTRISDLPEYTTITGSAFVPIVDINEQVASKNKKITINDLRKYFFTGTTTSSSFTEHTPGLYYFGDNSNGPLNLTGSITNVRTFVSRSFASTQDGVPIVKNFSSLFISRSVVVSPTRRCRGMLIFVDGDATISGSLRMTGRGAKFTGSDASFTTINPPYLGDYWSVQLFPSASYLSRVSAVGAAGAPAPAVGGVGVAGSAGILGRSGGGGSGGGASGAGGAGATGTSFSGGSGGGGSSPAPISNAGNAGSSFGGAGGSSAPSNGGGGAGNPNGSGGTAVGEGTGGLLILIVRGNLRIGPNGSIAANGIAGNNTPGGGGAGGSGGGVLYVYYGGTLTNNGTATASGGAGGPSSSPGGAGGAGTAIISKLNVAFPVGN